MLILIKGNKQKQTMKRRFELRKGLRLQNVVAYQCFGLVFPLL